MLRSVKFVQSVTVAQKSALKIVKLIAICYIAARRVDYERHNCDLIYRAIVIIVRHISLASWRCHFWV